MIVHLFNSSSVSGPERLALPALSGARTPCVIVNLLEDRISRLRDSDPLADYARALKLEYHPIRVNGRWDRNAFAALHQVLRGLQPVLVHAHAIKASIYLLRTRRRMESHGIPIVSTHHGVHGLPDWKVRLYEFFYRRYFLKKFDRALAVSSADYEFLLASGLDPSRVRLHCNGVDGRLVAPDQRSEASRRIRAQWLPQEPSVDGAFLFGVVGRLSPEKGHDRVLRVLASLNQLPCDRDWKCLMFGSGALENALRQKTIHLGLEKRILWMGYRKDVADELAGLDMLLSFSKAEGLPINLIEAGWAGTPVMATSVGGVMDLIPDGRYGCLVEPEEAPAASASSLLKILSSEGRAELRERANHLQERVIKEFTQSRWLERLSTIYSELGVGLDGRRAAGELKSGDGRGAL